MTAFSIISGLWALATLAVFLLAIRLSYAIERKRGVTGWHGLPRNTNLLASALGARSSDDAETVRMRRQLRLLLAVIAAGFALFGALVVFAGPAGAGLRG